MDKDEKKENKKEAENATKYGEFIPSYYAWRTLENQKNIARKLENITRDDNEK